MIAIPMIAPVAAKYKLQLLPGTKAGDSALCIPHTIAKVTKILTHIFNWLLAGLGGVVCCLFGKLMPCGTQPLICFFQPFLTFMLSTPV
jgi:hypothetical protein